MPTTRQVTFDLQEELYCAVRAICKDHNEGKILHHEKLLKTHCYNEGIRDWVEKKKKEKGGERKMGKWLECPQCGSKNVTQEGFDYICTDCHYEEQEV